MVRATNKPYMNHVIYSAHHRVHTAILVWFTVMSGFSLAGERTALEWSAVDLIPRDQGISVLRYGAYGFGAYPYGSVVPHAGMKVTVDGVPVRSVSPFGPDLELIPSQDIDTVDVHGFHTLDFRTGEVVEDQPVTATNFLMGEHRRFIVDMIFKRKIGERSGIVVNGVSSGLHTRDESDKNLLRTYRIKYYRNFTRGGSMNFAVNAFRDRDGLVDLDRSVHMGERKTDDVSVSLGVRDVPVRELVRVSSTAYYQSGLSRFDRYGKRKSLDDDVGGLNFSCAGGKGASAWRLSTSGEVQRFDSRIHRDDWTKRTADIIGSFSRTTDRERIVVDFGIMNSSKYGTGTGIEAEFAGTISPDYEFILHGTRMVEFPDIGKEYYTALVFGDSTTVFELDKYTVYAVEGGLRLKKNGFDASVYGFGSSSRLPLFQASTAVDIYRSEQFSSTRCFMSPQKNTLGYRLFFSVQRQGDYISSLDMNFTHRIGSWGESFHENWPYPSLDLSAVSQVSRNWFNENLNTVLRGKAEMMRFGDGRASPAGNYFFFDIDLVLKVSPLELFYRFENLTDENMIWFDSMGPLSSNAMWGGRWVFRN